MSRSILIQVTYKNNRKMSRGVTNGRNAEYRRPTMNKQHKIDSLTKAIERKEADIEKATATKQADFQKRLLKGLKKRLRIVIKYGPVHFTHDLNGTFVR